MPSSGKHTQRKGAKHVPSPNTNRSGRANEKAQEIKTRSESIVNKLRSKIPKGTESTPSEPQVEDDDEDVDTPKDLASAFNMVSSLGLEHEKGEKDDVHLHVTIPPRPPLTV